MDVFDLCGDWRVTRGGQARSIPATVPGCIHTDLLAAGEIQDPFYRTREIDVQWVGKARWTYSRSFELSDALRRRRRILLHCEGLDTLATVTMNGRRLGSTDNQFRQWEFDVTDVVRPGANTIDVRFDSPEPVQRARSASGRLAGNLTVPWTWPGRTYIRKSPSNYGWDWGPALPTCGIWRPLRLVAFDTARLTDVQIRQTHARTRVDLDVSATAESIGRASLAAAVTVKFGARTVAEGRADFRRGKAKVRLKVANPRLWWPAGMGDQPLYDVTVDLLDGSGGLLDTAAKRIGLRTLRLDRHDDKWGESFQFVANGVPFFAKGGNWIPADQFPTRLAAADYRRLLSDCADANMNMIRVWGGGIYEPDVFYDLCDELGLCIWQDFMFACSAVPADDPEYVANVRAEAIDNVRRIRHHACLALWCGNNEMEQICVGDEWTDRQMSWADYRRLFDDVLPKVVRRLDPQRDYWPSSAHSPRGDRSDHSNPKWGDAHLWNVWHRREPFEWYRTCEHRFNSEFGFQSFPEPKTVYAYTAPEDRNVTSPVMEHHQRSRSGNALILHYMLDWFRLPRDFEMLLWTSQIQHGMAMKYACEHWRRSMPRGMGTLYWQINDCWPVASWASIDYYGRWKALHYMARRFYGPVIVSGLEDAERGTVEVHVTSDLGRSRPGRVVWSATDLSGAELDGGMIPVRIPARKNARVKTLRLGKLMAEHGAANLLIWLSLEGSRRKVLAANLVTFARPKRMELPDPRIRAVVKREGDDGFRVKLTAARPALWAWCELTDSDARWSDNFVHLRRGEPSEIIARPVKPMTAAAFRKQLRVRSLIDTYRSE